MKDPLKLGADQSFVGVVTRISRTEYVVRFQIRDARTGAPIIARQSDLRIGADHSWNRGAVSLIKLLRLARIHRAAHGVVDDRAGFLSIEADAAVHARGGKQQRIGISGRCWDAVGDRAGPFGAAEQTIDLRIIGPGDGYSGGQ